MTAIYVQYVYFFLLIIQFIKSIKHKQFESDFISNTLLILAFISREIICAYKQNLSYIILKFHLLVMLFIISQQLLNYMRVFTSVGFIVTMLYKVFNQLHGFMIMLIYLIVVFTYSLMLFQTNQEGRENNAQIPLFVMSIFNTMKLGLGDSDLLQNFDNHPVFLTNSLSLLAIWFCLVVLINIVMLNFVIAMVSETYTFVKVLHIQYHYINKAKINANAQRTISMILPDKISKKIVDLYSILIVKFK